MLDLFLTQEAPELQARKEELLVEATLNEKQLSDLEEEILRILENAKGNILEDELAVETLSRAKVSVDDRKRYSATECSEATLHCRSCRTRCCGSKKIR